MKTDSHTSIKQQIDQRPHTLGYTSTKGSETSNHGTYTPKRSETYTLGEIATNILENSHYVKSPHPKQLRDLTPWEVPTQKYQRTGPLDLYPCRETSHIGTYTGIDSSETFCSQTHLPINHRFHFLVQTPTKSLGNLHLGNHTHKHFRDLTVRDIHPQTQQRPHTLWDTHPQTEQSLYPATHTPQMGQSAHTPRKHNRKSSETYQPGKYIHKDLRDLVYGEIYPQRCQLTHWHMYPQRPEI